MKIKYIMLSILGLALFSCSDFLVHEKKGAPSSDNFWKNETDLQRAVDGLYFFLGTDGVVGRGFMHYYNCSDDVVTGRAQAGCDRIKNFIADYSRDVTANWPEMYKLVKLCNDIIRYAPAMPVSSGAKNNALGQAYFFRAWAYLWLAPYYGDNGPNGGIPILTENTPIDQLDQPRPATVTENYLFCIEDFKRAAELLPYLNDIPKEEWGRPHKTACYAYIAKAALYNARYDATYYDVTVEYCDSVIRSGRHELYADFAGLFAMANNYSKEYIWSFPSNEKTGSILPGAVLENKGWTFYNGWGYFTPTLELVQAFDPADLRLPVTVIRPGDRITFLGNDRIYYSTESYSGMMLGKYFEPFTYADAIGKTINTSGDYPTTRLSIPLVRYAEVLLWKAEALIWTGRDGDNEINQVRARAGLEPLTGATKADLKRERRCELAGEFTNRFLDLVRWGDAETLCTQPLHGYSVSAKNTPVSSINDLEIKVVQVWAARTFDPAVNNLFPIPSKEIASSKNLIQNKGY